MIAYLNLRYLDDHRAQLFRSGLAALGYQILPGLCTKPAPDDIFVTWNRIGAGHQCALCFEKAGRPVIVAENASWGNEFAGQHWYHLSLNYHNTAGLYPVGDADRWNNLGIPLQPFRQRGETVILPQRGIGPPGVAMPQGWVNRQNGRIRMHPGKRPDVVPLEQDLAQAGRVVTWGSGAAIKALIMGIPVFSEMPNWIAAQDNTEQGRLDMFRRLAWSQFTYDEISSGFAFARLLNKCAS